MNNVQKKKMPVNRMANHPIRVWRPAGGTGTPLVCHWVMPVVAATEHGDCEQRSGRLEGLL